MSKSSYQWKKTETDANAIVDSVRTPFSGSNSGITASDGLNDRLFLEAKTREKHPIMNLYRDTEELAKKENKIPVLVLRENEAKEVLWVIEQKNLFKLLREIDLSKVDEKFPKGTTIYKLTETASTEGFNLFEIKEKLTIELKSIIRDKIISNDALEDVKNLSVLINMIDTILDYNRDDLEESDQEIVEEEDVT